MNDSKMKFNAKGTVIQLVKKVVFASFLQLLAASRRMSVVTLQRKILQTDLRNKLTY